MKFIVTLPNEIQTVENFRSLIANQMNRYYDGWSHDYDRRYDFQTIWYSLQDKGEIKAVSRVIYPFHKYTSPMQQANLKPFVFENYDRICEGSGFFYKDVKHIIILYYNMYRWAHKHGYKVCYSSYDIENQVTKRFYTQCIGFHSLPNNPEVIYKGFINKKTGKEAVWVPVRSTNFDKIIADLEAKYDYLIQFDIDTINIKKELGFVLETAV